MSPLAQIFLCGEEIGSARKSGQMPSFTTLHHEHRTPAPQVQQDLQQAIKQLPPGEHAADPSVPARVEELNRIQEHRRRGPQPLGEILPAVLAALSVNVAQSPQSGSSDPA